MRQRPSLIIINSTIQNATYNTNYVDDNLPHKFEKLDWKIIEYVNTDGIAFQSTSGFIFNNEIKNIMGDTLYDLQHRDWSNRSPEAFDHLRVDRNIFSMGMTKFITGNPENTTVYSNNLYLSTNVGGYWQNYRPFWIHNSFILPEKVERHIESDLNIKNMPDSYGKATYRGFHLIDNNRSYSKENAPYSGIRMNIFNNSVLSATTRGGGYLFTDKNENSIPSGIRFNTAGNLFLISTDRVAKITSSGQLFMNNDNKLETFSSRINFIHKYCYGESVNNIFQHIINNQNCKNLSLSGCMLIVVIHK